MKNGLIKKIIACLNIKKEASEITDYAITAVNTQSIEEFFVLEKLETTRTVDTDEIAVTIYKQIEEDFIGTSSFIISHDLSKNEINKLIDKALYSATFAKNKKYSLVKGEKKMKKVKKMDNVNPFDLLQEIAKIYFKENIDNNKCCIGFNSLEIFFTIKDVRFINSNGVDYEKKTCNIMVEAIPSFTDKATNFKTELYRMFKYKDVNDKLLDKVKEDAHSAASDILLRAEAVKLDGKKKVDIIINAKEIKGLFEEVVQNYNYAAVYQHSNLHSIGDDIQIKPLTKANIKLCKATKEDFFDGEGILLADTDIIKDGKVVNYYGGNRFASYLGIIPTGYLPSLKIKNGKKNINELKDNPYLEIIDMSGIQVDLYQDYIGGEIRLAKYFDGEKLITLSGLSFSGSLNYALNNYEVSKETTSITNYDGPKYMKIRNMEIN